LNVKHSIVIRSCWFCLLLPQAALWSSCEGASQRASFESVDAEKPLALPIEVLEAKLFSDDVGERSEGLAHVLASLASADEEQGGVLRALLLRSSLEALVAQAFGQLSGSSDAQRYAELLAQLSILPMPTDLSATDERTAFAQRLRPQARALMRATRWDMQARLCLAILDYVQGDVDDLSSAYHVRRVLEAMVDKQDDSLKPWIRLGAAFLALRAYASEARLSPRALSLAEVTGQFCPDGVRALREGREPGEVMDAMRRRCGFACSPPQALGPQARPLPPLDEGLFERCAEPLNLQNYLIDRSLRELDWLAARLREGAESSAMTAFALAFVAWVEQLDVEAQPELLLGRLRTGERLAEVALSLGELQATPVLVFAGERGIRFSPWPRSRSLRSDLAQPTAAYLPWGSARGLLRSAFRAACPDCGPVHEAQVLLDRGLGLDVVLQLFDFLKDVDVRQVSVLVWARDTQTFSALRLRIDQPPPRTTWLRLKDDDAVLVDPVGRERRIPVGELRRHLPEVYAAVSRFAMENPALEGLGLSLDPAATVQQWVEVLDGISHFRVGDVSQSTERLLSSPRMNSSGSLPLMGDLYVWEAPTASKE
jgi:hypothetical protein